jgi:hypothetical protein
MVYSQGFLQAILGAWVVGMLVALARVKAWQLASFFGPRGKRAPIWFGF